MNHGVESEADKTAGESSSWVCEVRVKVDQVAENLKCHPKKSEFILEASGSEGFLQQSNMIITFRELIEQLIVMRLEAVRLNSIIHILNNEN